MSNLIATSSGLTAIVGLGQTGLSVARLLACENRPFVLLDTRAAPVNLAAVQQEFPGIGIELGPLNPDTLCQVDEIILSPGIALAEPAIQLAIAQGVSVVGDIELFARRAQAPIVAITGSNAKSTVTTLVGDMARAAGLKVGVGGNIGTPALTLLQEQTPDLYVLELSSFQLETTSQLKARAATILNISADHLDRYDSLMAYHAAKQRVYFGAEKVVINRDDALTRPPLADGVSSLSFGLGTPDFNAFGVRFEAGVEYLAYAFENLIPVAEVALPGRHGIANALAALALGQAVGLPMAAMLDALREFRGLPHRCEPVAEFGGVTFINDSKGTNVGATLAALQGLAKPPQKLVLIAGGDGKGAVFDALAAPLKAAGRAAILLGRDAETIGAALEGATALVYVADMQTAVEQAFALAEPGDTVLLSPACASFDMFAGFEDRGRQFSAAVQKLQAAQV